MTTNTDIHDH